MQNLPGIAARSNLINHTMNNKRNYWFSRMSLDHILTDNNISFIYKNLKYNEKF